jgi:hypothetical protein
MKKTRVITGILLLSCYWSFSQEFRIAETRIEKIVMNDSIVHCSIYLSRPTVKPEVNRFYFWFDSRHVHWNQGAWHGYLLHGPYRVFLPGGQLTQAGQHEQGLKSGEWKEWREDGTIKRVERWQKGELHGQSFHVINDSITIGTRYKHGMIQRVDTIGKKRDVSLGRLKFKKIFSWISRERSPEIP